MNFLIFGEFWGGQLGGGLRYKKGEEILEEIRLGNSKKEGLVKNELPKGIREK